MIRATALPHPSTYSERRVRVRTRTASGPFVFGVDIDSIDGVGDRFVRRIAFSYRTVPAPVAFAIRQHFEQHAHATFELVLPRTGEAVDVGWLSPPSIRWESNRAATVVAEFETR